MKNSFNYSNIYFSSQKNGYRSSCIEKQTKSTKYRAKCHSFGVSSEANTMPDALYVGTCMKYHYPH